MKVAFVASNPSHVGPESPAIKNLRKWQEFMELEEYEVLFFNVSNKVTPNNRPLKKSEYELDRLEADLIGVHVVVTLGATASDAMERLAIPHFRLPHPSPRNRVLNDKYRIEVLLNHCKMFLEDICSNKLVL